MSSPNNKICLNALNIVFGTERVRRLLVHFGSAERAWLAGGSALIKVGIRAETARTILKKKETVDPGKEWERLKKENIALLTLDDETYPPLLRQIHAAPLTLYARGDVGIISKDAIAVVGTRSPSSYGRLVVSPLVGDLARSGLVVVSGLAQGIDALAHQATLEAGGKTVAVLGSGVDTLFPKINMALGEQIVEQGGAVISEYPPGTPPLKQHFPARNRIISGLSLGVFVIESRDPGGSLITANHALDQNREVFAIPGDIRRPTSEGTNRIIAQGAKLVRTTEDIFEELAVPLRRERKRETIEQLDPEEKNVLQILETEPLHVDTITKKAKLKPAKTNALLTSLELKGVVRDTGGNVYERIA